MCSSQEASKKLETLKGKALLWVAFLSSRSQPNNSKKKFSKVIPRSSHCICEVGDYLYILGGYGQNEEGDDAEIETSVERVSIKSGEVELENPSKFGGACIVTVIGKTLFKASEEGVEVMNLTSRKWSVVVAPEQYNLTRGCGWSKVAENTLLIYGGYNEEEKGLDSCYSWELIENKLIVRSHSFKLPFKEGFLNSPGVVVGGQLFVLQNILADQEDEEEEAASILEGERTLLSFDGANWE